MSLSTNCTDNCELERKRTLLAFGIISVISVLTSSTMILCILYLKLYRKIQQRFVLFLFMSNFMQALAPTLCLKYIYHPPQHGVLCVLQGWLATFGSDSASLWSANIALFISIVVFGISLPGKKYELATQLTWFIAFLLSSAGTFVTNPENLFVPVSNGAWCWISPEYPKIQLISEYILVITVIFFLIASYTSIAVYQCHKTQSVPEYRSNIAKLAGFPIIYIVVYSPIAIARILNVVGINVPIKVADITVCFISCDGILNAILYGYTRNIFRRAFVKLTGRHKERILLNTPENAFYYNKSNTLI